MEDITSRPVLAGPELDAAIAHARAALTALLRVPAGGDAAGYPKVLAEARALLALPGAGGLGLHDLLELELLDRTESLVHVGSWSPAGLRPLRVTGSLI